MVPRGNIILDKTHSFHGILGDSLKFVETFSLRKILSPRRLDDKAGILRCERMETIIHFRKNMMAQTSFYYYKNERVGTRLRKPNNEKSLFTIIL